MSPGITRSTSSTSAMSMINVGYIKSLPGILNSIEVGTGLICLIVILCMSRNYRDPWSGQPSTDFAGGKAEISFLLIIFSSLFCSSLILICSLTSVSTAALLAKTNFAFLFNLVAFGFYILVSLILMIEIASRNERSTEKEKGYAGKITAAVFGILNSLFYLLSTIFAYRTFRL